MESATVNGENSSDNLEKNLILNCAKEHNEDADFSDSTTPISNENDISPDKNEMPGKPISNLILNRDCEHDSTFQQCPSDSECTNEEKTNDTTSKQPEASFISSVSASSSSENSQNETDQELNSSKNLSCETSLTDCVISSELLENEENSKEDEENDKEDKAVNLSVEPTCSPHLNSSSPSDEKSETPSVCEPNILSKEIPSGMQKPSVDSAEKSLHDLLRSEVSDEDNGFPPFFDGLVTVGKYISVKGDFTLKSSDALIESPSLVAPFLLKEPDKFPSKEKDAKSENRGFFRSAAGEFLISLGLSRVTEWYHRDMTRIKTRLMKKEGKSDRLEQELEMHQNCYSQARKANEPFSHPFKSCEICNFVTESAVVLEGHLLVPHITPRREYRCSYCTHINRDPREMLFHMEAIHSKIGRIQPPVLFYECNYCTFESNSKVKLNSHINRCQKYFDRSVNQAPPKDYEVPALTPKPITVAVVKAYEKSISCMQRGRGRPRKIDYVPDSFHQHLNQISGNLNNRNMPFNQNMSLFRTLPHVTENMNVQNPVIPPPPVQLPPSAAIRPAHTNSVSQIRQGPPPLHLPPNNRFFQVVNSSGQMLPVLGNNQIVTSPAQYSFMHNPINSIPKKVHNSQAMNFYSNLYGNAVRQQQMTLRPPEQPISITPTPPKLQGPYPVQLSKTAPSNTQLQTSSLVVCEICDGYIKDLEQLRTHMQLIHKVKIHPKMLVSRPPLNCQKCQWRFFTDQGLERHLLGAHGLVTSNMQELANRSKDAGCCTICGRVYASKLVAHMNQIHKVTLKPAHLSYKCTVCSATFNLYRLFENHVYLVHSGAAKRPSDNSNSSPSRKIAKLSHSDFTSDSDGPAKSPSGKENEDAQKQASPERGCEENNFIRCSSCGDELLKSHNKSQERQLEISPHRKCEKCLKSDRPIVIRAEVSSACSVEDKLKDDKK